MSEYSNEAVSPDQAVRIFPALPVWFQPLFMAEIAGLYSIIPKVLICRKKENPVAAIPFYEKHRLGLTKAYNPVLHYYAPLHFQIPLRKLPNQNLLIKYEISKAIGDYLENKYKFVSLNLDPALSDIRGLRDAGLSVHPVYTFVKNLSSTPDFFINEMTTLRKAMNRGYQFRQENEPESLLDMLYQMYKRKKHPFDVPRDGHLRLLQNLSKAGFIEQFNVFLEEQIVSSMLVIPDTNRTVYAWQTATLEEHLPSGASLLLFWSLYQQLASGFDYFDLCGANSAGPSRLKAAMGAELKLFFQIRK